jgi:hypothetical protein
VIATEAAILKEPGLLCTFGQVARPSVAELPTSHLRCNLPPIEFRGCERGLDRLIGRPLLSQFCAEAHRPMTTPSVIRHEIRRKPLVGNELLVRELVDDALDRFGGMPFPLKLARQVFGRMLTPGEESNGGDFGRLVAAVLTCFGRACFGRAKF